LGFVERAFSQKIGRNKGFPIKGEVFFYIALQFKALCGASEGLRKPEFRGFPGIVFLSAPQGRHKPDSLLSALR